MNCKSKKLVLIGIITLLISCCIIAAGCTGTNIDNTPVDTGSSIPKTAIVTDLAGTWYTTTTFLDDKTEALIKLEIKQDGTGAATWYDKREVKPYFYNTFRIVQNPNGGFTIMLESPISDTWWQITLENGILTSSLGPTFSKTRVDGYWHGYEEPKPYPTPAISAEHNPADYVADGDYYLEDDAGRSFTETLWTGDIAPYVKKYANLPKLSKGGSPAGEWVKYVRSLSKAYHVQEPSSPVTYQTIDETMNRGTGTCDDLVILAARGLKELGINPVILVFTDHMDLGIPEEDYLYLHNQILKNNYASFQSSNNKFNGYYYIDISDYQNSLDLGDITKETGFTYDMTLKKIIPLDNKPRTTSTTTGGITTKKPSS